MPIDTPRWVRDAVFYQVFPDRFARSGRVPSPGPLEAWDAPPTGTGFKGGDLYGVADHLDHIADLGANAIYLNPIFASTANHRYHTCDYLRIDPLLGGEAAFRHLLDAAHARGIRVVIDGVFNHCGRGFYPFQHVLETGAASPYRDWFFLNPAFLEPGRSIRAYPDGAEPVLELSAVDLGDRDGSATFRDLGYQAWWDLPALPKLNVRNPEVREYLLAAGEHWIRFGVDGWRLDVPEDLEDPDFWREFRRRIRAIDPEAYILAEIWFPKAEVLRGDQYDATMNYPFLTAVVSFAAGSHLDLAVAAQHGWLGAAVRRARRAGLRRAARAADDRARSRRGRGPVQPARQPRHAAPADDRGRRRGERPPRRAGAGDAARSTRRVLRRRDRHDGLDRPRRARGVPVGPAGDLGRLDPGLPARRLRAPPRAAGAARRVVQARRGAGLDGRLGAGAGRGGRAGRPQQRRRARDARGRGPGARRLPAPGRAAPRRRRARRVRARIGRLRRLPARPDRAGLPGLARDVDRHAGLGQGRGVLPGVPRSLRAQRARRGARPARGLGRAADDARLQGRRPVRRRGPARRPRRPRDHGHLPHPGVRVGLEPPLPHVRLLQGRPAAGRRRGPASAARRGARARDARDPRRRVQPREPRLLGVQPHPRVRPRVAVPRLVPGRPRGARPGPPAARLSRRVPAPRGRGATADPRASGPRRASRWATTRGGTCRPCPSSTPTTRRCAST